MVDCTHTHVLDRRSFIALGTASAAALAFAGAVSGSAYAVTGNKIAIICTNDVHCQIDSANDTEGIQTKLGYAGVATVYKEAQSAYGADNAILVDAGDNLQGLSTGTLTQGEALVELMNATGYALSAIGNHDFDYGIPRLQELMAKASYTPLACNFYEIASGKRLFAPYAIKQLGGKKVAFVGISTPETLQKSNPKSFEDAEGNYLYTFKEDTTGQALYECVQEAVDSVKNEGADYVVALAHLGQTSITSRWRSDAVIQNTRGIDVLLDGHSHEIYHNSAVNLDAKNIPIIQSGTNLTAVSRIIINLDNGEITVENVLPPQDPDPDVARAVADVNAGLASIKTKKIAQSDNMLYAFEDDKTTWLVRRYETNLGDLVSDAYFSGLGTDIAICNGGGIRADIEPGDITYGDALNVNPFSNNIAVVAASGQIILDALEMGARKWPDLNGGFLQVAGMSYEIRTDIASTVEVSESGEFIRVKGVRRVQNVQIGGKAIDASASYTVAGNSYMLINGGDGFNMWKNATPVTSEGPVDFDVLADYLQKTLGGVVGSEYAARLGQGRIVFKDGPDPEPVPSRTDSGNTGKAVNTGDNADAFVVAAVAAAGAVATAAGIRKANGS